MSPDNMKIAAALRQTAAARRKEAQIHEEAKLLKCAQICVAARGLSALQQIIEGASNANN